jgi:hypothetical protein
LIVAKNRKVPPEAEEAGGENAGQNRAGGTGLPVLFLLSDEKRDFTHFTCLPAEYQ